VAIVIVWNVVKPIISRGTEQIEGSIFTTQLEIQEANMYISGGGQVRIKRGTGKGEISALKFIFYDESGESVIVEEDGTMDHCILPDELETKICEFSASDVNINVVSVSVVPMFGNNAGMEVSEDDIDDTTPGLVSWWKFDDESDVGKDSVGENHGQNYGAIWDENGVISGGFLEFDGNSWIMVPHNSDLNLAYGTWSLWMLADINQCGGIKENCVPRILRKIDSDGGFDMTLSYTLAPPTGATIFAHQSQGEGWDEYLNSDDLYDFAVNQQWVHVVYTLDENKIAKVYTNGDYEKSEDWSSVGLIHPTTQMMYIGGVGIESMYNFNGSIDNVMIFDKALTKNEITAIYNNQNKK
jgi:hypothetical protein